MFCHLKTGEVRNIRYLALGYPYWDVPAIGALCDIMKSSNLQNCVFEQIP